MIYKQIKLGAAAQKLMWETSNNNNDGLIGDYNQWVWLHISLQTDTDMLHKQITICWAWLPVLCSLSQDLRKNNQEATAGLDYDTSTTIGGVANEEAGLQ